MGWWWDGKVMIMVQMNGTLSINNMCPGLVVLSVSSSLVVMGG